MTNAIPRSTISIRGKGKGFPVTAGLAALLVAVSMASLSIGAAHLSPHEIVDGLFGQSDVAMIIIRDIRAPRLVLALSIGGFLGLSGAALQGLLRNPLAEAAVFGAPQGAALGAVIVHYLGLSDALSFWLPIAAIAGALLSSILLFGVAGRSRGENLVLAGLAIGSLASAAVALILSLSPNPFAMTEILFWLMGSLEDRSLRHVLLSLPLLALACVLLMRFGAGYRALTLGEEAAFSLGFDISRLKILTILAVSIGSGASVAVAGSIGFIGLMAPHLARAFVGSDPQRIMAPSALVGSILLTSADILVRIVPSTSEVRIGVVTALLGGPLFLYIALSNRVGFGAAR